MPLPWCKSIGGHCIRRGLIASVIAVIAVGALLGVRRRACHDFTELAAAAGWQLSVAGADSGLFTTVLRDARLTSRQTAGIVIETDRIELRHGLRLRPRVVVTGVRGSFRGEAAVIMDKVVLTWQPGSAAGVLRAEQVRVGDRFWPRAQWAFERHKDAVLVGWGETVAQSRIQLSWFPPWQGITRWLLDVQHQPLRPLGAGMGWQPGPAFDATKIAGTLSLDMPDDRSEPVRGRVQLVLDDWPSGANAAITPFVGSTLSLVSNWMPAADGRGWALSKVRITTPVFDMAGTGRLDPSSPGAPSLDIEASGERTCQQLRVLLPPSPERQRVEDFLAHRPGSQEGSRSPKARLELVWRRAERPLWRFEAACGLEAPTTLVP